MTTRIRPVCSTSADRYGQRHGKNAAPRFARRICDGSTVFFDNPPYYVQPEPRSAEMPAAEPLEEARAAFRRDAVAVVFHRDRHAASIAGAASDYMATPRSRIERVRDEIDDRAPNLVRIAQRDQRMRTHLGTKLDALDLAHRLELFDDSCHQIHAGHRFAHRRGLAGLVARYQQQRFDDPALVVVRRQRRTQDAAIAVGELAVCARQRLVHRYVRGGERRPQVVRQRVNDVTDHVAAIRQLILLARNLLVALSELCEQTRLLERDRRLLREARERRARVGNEGLPRTDRCDQDVLHAPARRDRGGERLARAECLQGEAPEHVAVCDREDVVFLYGPRRQRRDLIREGAALDRDVRVACGVRQNQRQPKGRLASDQHHVRGPEELDRLAEDGALHELDVERLAHSPRRAAQRFFDVDLALSPRRCAGLARILLRSDAEIADQYEGRRQEKAIADGDGIPVSPRLNPVDITGDRICDLRRDDQVRRQTPLQRQAAERDRAVEQDCSDEQLRRDQVDDPRKYEQSVAEQGHGSAFRAERRGRLA